MTDTQQSSAVQRLPHRTIPAAFAERVRETPDDAAYIHFENGAWITLTWRDIADRVARRRAAFAASGLQPGDRVGIFLPNGVAWVVSDLAAMSESLVTVPVYTRDSAANICHVLRDSGAALCLTDTAERWAALDTARADLPALKHLWVLRGDAGDDPRATPCPDPETGAPRDLSQPDGSPDDLATIVYTSGTTGPPKGVMMPHRALIWNASAVSQLCPITKADVFLSILPLAHAFERSLGYVCPMLGNSAVAFGRSVEDLNEDMKTVQPTVMLAVPRLFEKVRETAIEKARASILWRNLLAWTEALGWRRRMAGEGRCPHPSLAARLLWKLFGQSVAAHVRAAFGGRIRMMICGGAPLAPETSQFFAAMDLPLLQGYGLTEAGPAVTGTTIENRRSDSVGFALPGSELAIGARQELLVKSPGLMLGYWNKPDATKEVIDEEGWLHTGDAAEVRDGRVYIQGRIKDILVLSTGENVNPVPIETALLSDPLIEQVCVLGDGKPYCTAVVVVDPVKLQEWLGEVQLSPDADHWPKTRRALARRFSKLMVDIPPFACIRDVVVET